MTLSTFIWTRLQSKTSHSSKYFHSDISLYSLRSLTVTSLSMIWVTCSYISKVTTNHWCSKSTWTLSGNWQLRLNFQYPRKRGTVGCACHLRWVARWISRFDHWVYQTSSCWGRSVAALRQHTILGDPKMQKPEEARHPRVRSSEVTFTSIDLQVIIKAGRDFSHIPLQSECPTLSQPIHEKSRNFNKS